MSQHSDATKVLSPERASELLLAFNEEIRRLVNILSDISEAKTLPPDLEDQVMGVGEKLSARYMTALLEDLGIAATYLDLADIIDFDATGGLNEHFYSQLQSLIRQKISDCNSAIPVNNIFFSYMAAVVDILSRSSRVTLAGCLVVYLRTVDVVTPIY